MLIRLHDNVDKSRLYVVKIHLISNYIGSKWHVNTHMIDEAAFFLPISSELSVVRALQRANASPDRELSTVPGMELLQDEGGFCTKTRKKERNGPPSVNQGFFIASHSSCHCRQHLPQYTTLAIVYNTCHTCHCIQQPVPKPPHPHTYPILSDNLSPQCSHIIMTIQWLPTTIVANKLT